MLKNNERRVLELEDSLQKNLQNLSDSKSEIASLMDEKSFLKNSIEKSKNELESTRSQHNNVKY